MTDTLQRQGLVLAFASLACVGLAFWSLWHYDVFSSGEDVNIVIQPSLLRWVVALVVGLLVPQFLIAAARTLGLGKFCWRLAAFLRNVETMPQKVDDIHAAVCEAKRPGPSAVAPVVKEEL